VKFLLDENFPLAFYRRLRDAGKDVEHVIALGQRGVHDDVLRQRLAAETLVFSPKIISVGPGLQSGPPGSGLESVPAMRQQV
jgi:hypothetical protein